MMRILVLLIMTCFLFYPTFAAPPTKAGLEKKGDIWVLDKGSTHGVKVGLEGYFLKKSDAAPDVKVGHFKISRVFKVVSYATVDNWSEGFTAKDAQWAQFIDTLTPTVSGSKRKPGKKTVVAKGKDRRWYLDKGDAEFEKANYEGALKYYQEVLEKDANDPGAVSREKFAKGKLYVQQGDLEIENSARNAAFEYYLMAFLNLGSKDSALAKKILDLWDLDESLYSKLEDFKIDQKSILKAVINSCENAIKEGSVEELPELLVKLRKHVHDEKLKLKLDDLEISREIHIDFTTGNYSNILDVIELALQENNLYKASFITRRLEDLELEESNNKRLAVIKEKLAAKQDQIESQKEGLLKEEKIKNLEAEAATHVNLKEFDEAIKCYIKIIQLEPGTDNYNKKIEELRIKKFQYEKNSKEIKARLDRDNLIMQAEDNAKKELIQDALDFYIQAYNIFPEDGKAIAGIAVLLQTCEPEDAAYITGDLLERKFSKFKKDFVCHMTNNYAGSKDKVGLEMLGKIGFLKGYKASLDLISQFKANLHKLNLDSANTAMTAVDFSKALSLYKTAEAYVKNETVEKAIKIAEFLSSIKEAITKANIKAAVAMLKALPMENRKAIVNSLLKLTDRYLDDGNARNAKLLMKRLSDYKKFIPSLKTDLAELKKKEKGLKNKK
ncbi:MAG: hypothetical protein GY765_37595 [bacterium]|nr:hypothetical protein [bacterium]